MTNKEITIFKSGVHNLLSDDIIPEDAASDESNWYTQDGRIKLIPGRVPVGEEGDEGKITGEIFGYKVNGEKIHWRKAGHKIQYFDEETLLWIDVITGGLTESADYSFANYSSLAGTFTFAIGVDGIFKMHNAQPGNYLAMYDEPTNFQGKALIDRGRMILWDRVKDKTGLYGSHIDPQNSVVYNTEVDELLGASGNDTYGGILIAPQQIVTITIDDPAVITLEKHGFRVGTQVIFSTTIALPTGIVAEQIYYVIDEGLTADEFEISETKGGDPVVTTGSQDGVQTVSPKHRNVFGVVITGEVAAGMETFTDDYLGNLTSNFGGVGTINYITGAYYVTFSDDVSTGNIYANYQWEDSNNEGLTDFTHSFPRAPSEGFQFPQDEGGDPILNVLVGQDGAYYSLKSVNSYRLALSDDDTTATNEVYRKELGLPAWRAAVSIGAGIIFMNTSNPSKPEMTILRKNNLGDNVEPYILFPQFKFSNYVYDDCAIDFYERYVVVACRTPDSDFNNVILLCDFVQKTVDITAYQARTFARSDGNLYIGSPITLSIDKVFNGFDDDGLIIQNFYDTKNESYDSGRLKKYRKIRLKGRISKSQRYAVYISYDNTTFQLIGTVLGNASYVDFQSGIAIGGHMIGEQQIGGDPVSTETFEYFVEIRLKKVPKFRVRKLRFIALDYGYVDIESMMSWDIMAYEDKIPARFRQKQNVSLDGGETNMPNPQFVV